MVPVRGTYRYELVPPRTSSYEASYARIRVSYIPVCSKLVIRVSYICSKLVINIILSAFVCLMTANPVSSIKGYLKEKKNPARVSSFPHKRPSPDNYGQFMGPALGQHFI
jgi:hypothetical protein